MNRAVGKSSAWYMRPFEQVGLAVISILQVVGGYCLILIKTLKAFLRFQIDRDEFLRSLYCCGVQSLPIIATTAAFVGGIMVLQGALYIRSIGAYSLVGWFAAMGFMREVGPVFIGLMFSGKVGANNTAQIASMKVTEQISALEILAIDPYSYLVIPRLSAMILSLTCLIIIGDLTALIAGCLIAKIMLGVTPLMFYHSIVNLVIPGDFIIGVIKGALYGAAIGISSCHHGLATEGGAKSVGEAVNAQVVGSAVMIFVIDYLLAGIN